MPFGKNPNRRNSLEKINKKRNVDISDGTAMTDVSEGKDIDFLPLIFRKPENTNLPGTNHRIQAQFHDCNIKFYPHTNEIGDYLKASFSDTFCQRPDFETIYMFLT